MEKIIAAFVLAFFIGAFCRYFEVPLPSPPSLIGVGLIAAITIGYMVAGKFLGAAS